MNRQNFNQSVGFPFETNILDEMQKAYTIFNALGALAGNFTIISGCTTVGPTVSDGVVFINGEILEFRGGVAQANVIIIEEKQALEFEDGNAHDVIYTRYATFGTATTQWPWIRFERGFETKEIPGALAFKEDKTTVDALIGRIVALEKHLASTIPIGLIAVWGQPMGDIPDGWEEYVPLRGRMPVGLNTSDPLFDTLLDYGGSPTHTLTINQMPEHDHDVVVYAGVQGTNANAHINSPVNGLSYDKTSKKGGDQAFSIMNPYRVVHFIQYLG